MHVLRDFSFLGPGTLRAALVNTQSVFTSTAQRSAAQRMCERPRPLMTEHLLTESRAVLTNGHTGHVPRAPGFFSL